MIEEKEDVEAAIDNCHNLLYTINKIEEYKDYLSKDDIISILRYYYIFNKEIFNNIL